MTATELMRRIDESISGGRSFGPAFERDGCTVIPVALVVGGGGGGDDQTEPGDSAAGDERLRRRPWHRRGEGGGFGLVSWPVGVYVVKDGEARWRPLVSAGDVGFFILMLAGVFARKRRRRPAVRR